MGGYSKPRSGQSIGTGPARSAAFYADAIDAIESFKRGNPPPSGAKLDVRGPMVFIRNDSGADLKLGEVVELGDYLLDEENPYAWWYEGKAVSTTFRMRYAIAAEPIPEDTIGAAWVRGPAVLRYAGSAPSSGAGFGPKPSTVTLEPGYPCCAIVDEVIDSTEKLAGCTLDRIDKLLCKATAFLPNGSASSDYQIWKGTIGGGANSGFTTLPSVELVQGIPTNRFFLARWVNGGWVGRALGGGTPLYKAKLNGALLATDTNATIDNVTSLSGESAPSPTSAANLLDLAGDDNDDCYIVENSNGSSATYELLNVLHHDCEGA